MRFAEIDKKKRFCGDGLITLVGNHVMIPRANNVKCHNGDR